MEHERPPKTLMMAQGWLQSLDRTLPAFVRSLVFTLDKLTV